MNMKSELSVDATSRRNVWAIQPEALLSLNSANYARLLAEQKTAGASSPFAMSALETEEASGSIALINIRGMITPYGSPFLAMLGLGGGGLMGFREAFHEALADDGVDSIVLNINSPGGLVSLVPETATEIREARGTKPIVAVANTLAASAAYYLAAQADEVVVTPSGEVGSIGTLIRHEDISKLLDDEGVKISLIYAGKYKTEGNPFEPLTKEARAAMQAVADEFTSMFVADVAAGRKVTAKTVAEGYGEGRTLLAKQALETGMVDRVATLEDTIKRLGGAGDPEEAEPGEEEDEGAEAAVDAEAPSAVHLDGRVVAEAVSRAAERPAEERSPALSQEDRARLAAVLLG
jgi:capsid assembly protease